MSHLLTHKKATRGFTLIELLVVIAIIGVLATVVLASLNNARRKSRDARRITDIKQLQIALELYFDISNEYPNGSSTCNNPNTSAVEDSYGLQDLVTSGFISSIPRDPVNGNCYGYRTKVAPALTYHLAAVLEDSANSALTQDKDCADGTAGVCDTTTVAFTLGGNGSSGTTQIYGANTCTASTGSDTCYDVVP